MSSPEEARPAPDGPDPADLPAAGASTLPDDALPTDRAAALEEELSRTALRLQAAEARFRSIVDRSVDGVIVLDGKERVRYANNAAEDLFGRTAEELMGSEFGHPATAGETTEIDVLRPGAEPVVAEMRVARTTWEGEDGLLVLMRDITDRRAAEERERELIREQTAREEAEAHARRSQYLARVSEALGAKLDLDALLRSLADVIVEELGDVCLIDIDDSYGPLRRLVGARRDYAQRALLKGLEDRPVRLGLETPEARVFRTGESLLVPELEDGWFDGPRETGEDGTELAIYRALKPASLMMVSLHAGALPWGIVTVLRCGDDDRFQPADLALLEEVVRRAGIAVENARLYHLAREASNAKSNLLAIVSHELRTPLSAVSGYADLLDQEVAGPLNEKQQEYVDGIRRSGEHLTRLIDKIITFARLEGDHEKVQWGEVDLGRMLEEVDTLTRPLASRKGLELHVEIPEADVGGGIPVVTDEDKLSQVLINLVTNAVKYTPAGEVWLTCEVTDDLVVLQVRDTGPGIPPDRVEEIFEPFRQLENPNTRREGGTGLGLAVVKSLTRLMEGEIRVESEEGGGATFLVRLPRRPSGAELTEPGA